MDKMETERLNNPAARLHKFLSELSRLPEGNPARSCFSAVLGVQTDNTAALLHRVAQMAELADVAEEKLRKRNAGGRYFSWTGAVKRAFEAISLTGPISGFVAPLRQDSSIALERLAFAADLLSQPGDEKEIEDAKLTEIHDGLVELQREIHESEIEGELKLFLLYQIGVILDAISQYKFFGLGPLEKATNQTIGALVRHPVGPNLREMPIGKKLLKIISNLAEIVSNARDLVVLLEFVQKMLK
jgi:hypothetical protein